MSLLGALIIIVGGGGHGRVVAEAARAAGARVVAFADAVLAGSLVDGVPVIDAEPTVVARACFEHGAVAAVAIGDNATRQRMHAALAAAGVTIASVIHPSAIVLGGAQLGVGVQVLAGAVLGVGSVIGDGCIVNTSASIDHDCRVGAFCHLSPGVHTGGQVELGEGVHLAIGVSVRNRLTVGAWSQIGVGAAVVTDVPAHVVAYGVPARIIRQLES